MGPKAEVEVFLKSLVNILRYRLTTSTPGQFGVGDPDVDSIRPQGAYALWGLFFISCTRKNKKGGDIMDYVFWVWLVCALVADTASLIAQR